MAFIPVTNTALVDLVFEQHGQICENTLWFEFGSAIAISDLQDLRTYVVEWWQDSILPLTSIDTTLLRVKATDMTSETSPSYEAALTSGNVGTVNSSSQANSVTWTIKFTTALRGRSFRGRNYIIGIPGNAIADNEISSTQANNYVTAYEFLIGSFASTGWTHVVVSKFTNGGVRLSGVTTPVIGYSYADLTLDAQRRRLPGRGD